MKNQPKAVRCAIYTRKSSDEGLEQEFNSLHAQRECCENYIKSMAGEGWVVRAEPYDDGGFSGGNMKRPALQRLMADVQAGLIDVIVVYKLDRFSRNMRDFFTMLGVLEKHNVAFVAVTQQFNTATSTGRLMLNMLLSFAQFEREIVSERTRDKIAMSRKRGKWAGGRPILGYDVDRHSKKLLVNTEEAERVRAIFDLYLKHEALMPVVAELDTRGWLNKQWTTAKGEQWEGRGFNKCSLHKLLTNTAYIGLVKHKDQRYPGEHQAIVDERTFKRVQEILKRNGITGGAMVRNKYGALLKGLMRCTCCDCSMGHTYSSKDGKLKYRYYLCLSASKRGWHTCPGPSVPAGEVEAFVVERIRGATADRALVTQTARELRRESPGCRLSERDVRAAFARFDELWATLSPREQMQVIRLLVNRVEWDPRNEQIRIVFAPTGITGLVEQTKQEQQQEAA